MRRSICETASNTRLSTRKLEEDVNSLESSLHRTNSLLRRLYPLIRERENNISLPRRWDVSQTSSYLEISRNGFTVSFKKNASLQDDTDPSGVVRADAPIPSSIGLYYFEIKIIHGHRGCMGIGLSKAGGELNRMPGWDPSCFGYHGDDGNFFFACGNGTPYGPKFGTGDVIGCGIDTMLNQVFFTKNGKHLGVAHQGTEPLGELYPTVGLKTPGEQLQANFGLKPFMFDFESYCKMLNKDKASVLERTKMPENIGLKMNRIVSSFLGNSGAFETLKAFKTASSQKMNENAFLEHRKELADMIMNAEQGAVIQEKLEEYFPGCLERDSRVQLALYCLRYIDLTSTLLDPPSSFKKPISEYCQPRYPTESQQKRKNNITGKSQKRNRQSCHTSDISESASRRCITDKKPESFLNNPKINENFIDEDTGEEIIRIENQTITKSMYVDLCSSEQYEKLSYIIKMGREMTKLSKVVNLTTKEREILEASMFIPFSTCRFDKHPLSSAQRRYIANLVTVMVNDSLNFDESNGDFDNAGSDTKVYSELRGMFYAWKGLHADASARDNPSAAIAFMRSMVVQLENFGEGSIDYSDEPMEEDQQKESNDDTEQ